MALALAEHMADTEGHVERLEQIFKIINKTARAKSCDAILGLSLEGDHVIDAYDEAVRDAGIIGVAQAVEHYEIARYGMLAAWAKQLGFDAAAELLIATLDEEKAANANLSGLAETINPLAAVNHISGHGRAALRER